MPEAADPIAALVELLKPDAAIAALAGTRVFGGELPPKEAKHMPRGALILSASGGTSLTGGSYAEHDTTRVDLFAYGATPNEATRLLGAGALAMRRIQRSVAADTLVHWARPAGGAASGRDPALAWPRAFQSFQVFHGLAKVPRLLAAADFKNGIHQIDGAISSFAEMWVDGAVLNPALYQPLNIVPGVGIVGDSSEGNTKMLLFALEGSELWGLLGIPRPGVTFVIDYSINSSGNRRAEVGCWADNDPVFDDYWGFESYFRTTNNARTLLDANNPYDPGVETAGQHRAAVTFSSDFLAMSVDGAASVIQNAPSPNVSANEFYVDIQAGATGTTGIATTIVEKITFHPPQEPAMLERLSAQ